jgi:hypothetical protein
MIAIVIAMVVPPRPIFLLLILIELAELTMLIAVSLSRPPVVVDNLIVVPYVIVRVVGVVHADGHGMVVRASNSRQ